MSSESTGIEILDQYRNISKKLKKTFFKKPNENEALESYVALARECESSKLHSYAGLCWNAAAKCEHSLGNFVGESANLLKSARQYAIAEEKNNEIGSVNSDCNNFHAALYAYKLAASKYEKNSPLLISLHFEIVDFLQRIRKNDYIEFYLKEALKQCTTNGLIKIQCLKLLAQHYISIGNYLSALEMFTEIYNSIDKTGFINGAYEDILLNCEINRVLLLLILKPSPHKLTPELTKILEKYTWGDKNDDNLKFCKMSDHLFILLESLVTTCQSADTNYLIELEGCLWPFLTSEQKDLLRVLVKIHHS